MDNSLKLKQYIDGRFGYKTLILFGCLGILFALGVIYFVGSVIPNERIPMFCPGNEPNNNCVKIR